MDNEQPKYREVPDTHLLAIAITSIVGETRRTIIIGNLATVNRQAGRAGKPGSNAGCNSLATIARLDEVGPLLLPYTVYHLLPHICFYSCVSNRRVKTVSKVNNHIFLCRSTPGHCNSLHLPDNNHTLPDLPDNNHTLPDTRLQARRTPGRTQEN